MVRCRSCASSQWSVPLALCQRIEASPRQAAGNLHRKDDNFLDIRSLTPQQATGNALAYAVQLSGQTQKA
jgi:hypothetical protein